MAYKFNPFTGNLDLVGAGGTGSSPITPLFDYYTDASTSGAGETDLYSSTIPAGQLAANGDKIFFSYLVNSSDGATGGNLALYFGGSSNILAFPLGTAVIRSSGAWPINITGYVIRVSSSVVRVMVQSFGDFDAGFSPSTYLEVTGLTLSNTQILKITGTRTAGSGNIVARMGTVYYQAAA